MRKKATRMAKRMGLTFLAMEGMQAAALAGVTRWAGRKLSRRDHRVLRFAGQALTVAASVIPVAAHFRRRLA
jgi:hypothetical protein